MTTKVSQRAAERAIEVFALRMYSRHSIPAATLVPEAVRIALQRGDPVATVLGDDARLLMMAAGLGGGDGRRKVDRFTSEALALLTIANDRADAAFPPEPVESPARESEFDAWLRSKGARGPSRQRLMKEAEQEAEARGVFAFRALFLIGPEEGPVRIGVSKQPMDQLRLTNRHCLIDSKLGFERYATSDAKAHRIMHSVLEYAKVRGLRHPNKNDVLTIPMTTAIAVVDRISAQLGIALLTKDEKNRAIAEFERSEREREDGLRPW